MNNKIIQDAGELILSGNIGIERENLRVTSDGRLSKSSDPFASEQYITRDFSENQTELNVPPEPSVEQAYASLVSMTESMSKHLFSLPQPEYLWPFSNAPFIENESEIIPAVFSGEKYDETEYRYFLAEKYGKKLMTFSGIHINYSLSDKLLFFISEREKRTNLNNIKNRLYLNMAYNASEYGWIVSMLTAASPLSDESFFRKTAVPKTVINGMSTLRCSKYGYWNRFNPVLNYTDIEKYALSIRRYIDKRMIIRASELYYPVRIKPSGIYSPENIIKSGVDHIEFRMVDLNPYEPAGMNIEDLRFVKLFLVWACFGSEDRENRFSAEHLVNNYKQTAVYDIDNATVLDEKGREVNAVNAGMNILNNMIVFYKNLSLDVLDSISRMKKRLLNPTLRYSVRLMGLNSMDFTSVGLKIAEKHATGFD